jgi:hypothetical protein
LIELNEEISKNKNIFLCFSKCFAFSQTLSSNLSKDKVALGEKVVFRVSVNDLHGRDVISMPKNELFLFILKKQKMRLIKLLIITAEQ